MKTQLLLALGAADSKRHIDQTVDVPTGTRALRITLDFAPAATDGVRNMLCLSVYGPDGFRGAGHRHRPNGPHDVTISESWATPGFLPGRLTPGRWTVEIDTHMVYGATVCTADLRVECLPSVPSPGVQAEAGPAATRPTPGAAVPALPALPAGWLRGDIHAHSLHSDARWRVADLLDRARRLGLDFVALTDHNTVSGLAELGDPDLLTLPGMELTTFWGHALALGLTDWTDWRTRPDAHAMADVAREVAGRGGILVIAHPMAEGDPACTGCRWQYPDTSPGPARHVEIFNGGIDDARNAQALDTWYGWLDAGHTVYATAGTDAHAPEHMAPGKRFNVVRCRRRTAAAVLDALSGGRSYVSRGPHLALTAVGPGGRMAAPGDLVDPGAVVVEGAWRNAEPASTVRVVTNGEVLAEWPSGTAAHSRGEVSEGRAAAWTGSGRARADLTLPPGAWFLLELRDGHGQLAAVTNPIRASR